MATAQRLMLELCGVHAFVFTHIPGVYEFRGKKARYFLLRKFSYEWRTITGYDNTLLQRVDPTVPLPDRDTNNIRLSAVVSAAHEVLSKNHGTLDLEFTILWKFALRFDGYLYGQEIGFDVMDLNDARPILTTWWKDGTWPDAPLLQLTLFYRLQRCMKEYSGYHEIWKPFRSLFFLTAKYTFPDEYRFIGMEHKYQEILSYHGGNVDSILNVVRALQAERPCDNNIP